MKGLSEQEQLALGITLAAMGHKYQFDKGGKPYILHPLHLMNQLLFDTQLATIAVMHDLIEDTDLTLSILVLAGFSDRVITALDLLTHSKGVSYEDYILMISSNYDAIRVKRKDLQHNSCATRLKGVTEKDFLRMQKYQKAYTFLGEARSKFK